MVFVDAWLDGKFIDWREVMVSPLSHGFSRGVSIFEVALVADTLGGPTIFMHDQHLERFYESARLLHMDLGIGKQELSDAIMALAKRNQVTDGLLKYHAYYPAVEMNPVPMDKRVSVVIYCGNNPDFGFDPVKARRPQAAQVSSYLKLSGASVPIKAKVTGYYVGGYLAYVEAAEKGFNHAIFVDSDGYVTEGATASHFYVTGGEIITPPLERILAGTTRATVIQVARDQGLKVREEDIRPQELEGMDEGFCASSISKLAPFKSINGRELDPCPGPVTAKVVQAMDQVYANQYPGFEKYHVPIA